MENVVKKKIPIVAVIYPNTLALLGMKQILQSVIPIMTVNTYMSFEELIENNVDEFFHYFVSMNVVLEHRQFFLDHKRKTIVLTSSTDPNVQLSDFNCICINDSEERLIRSLLILEQHAHANGKNLPPIQNDNIPKVLSDREIEVLSLIVKGFINKQIADKLNIGMTTVITHRKNIMDKLGVKSVSALTIYAVMHGYVDISNI